MNFAPQMETAEMSDADLDNVAGGQAGGSLAGVGGGGAAGLYVEVGNIGIGAGVGASVSPEGVSADVVLHVSKY
jgi:hypothetical protein